MAINPQAIRLVSEAQRLLLDHGVGQRELARAAGGSPSTSRDWLVGKTSPCQNKRSAIALAFDYCTAGLWDVKPHGIGMLPPREAKRAAPPAAAPPAAAPPAPPAIAPPSSPASPPSAPPGLPLPVRPHVAPQPPLTGSRAPTRALDDAEFPPGSAKRSAKELLDRVQSWREEAEADRNLDWLAKLIPQESKAIAELARYSGELSASDEDRMTRTTRWSEVVAALRLALRPYPDAAEAAGMALAAFDSTRRGV